MTEKLRECARPASSVKHSNKVVHTVSRAALTDLNHSLEPAIRHNRTVRNESWLEMRDKIVGS